MTAASSRFRKKPVVIEAVQYTGGNWFEVMTFVGDRVKAEGDGLIIQTLEGQHIASPGDWIIRGVKGEHYPCKPDIFAATYEPAGSNEAGHGLPELPEWAKRDDLGGLVPSQIRSELRAYARAALALSRGVPADMVLVPREPTEAMLSAMDMCLMAGPEDAYRAMLAGAPAASGGEFVNVPRELTPSMLEAAVQEEACGNDFPDMWEAAIATYLFDKENGNG